MRDIESLYDSQIESEAEFTVNLDALGNITIKAPEDSLCSAISPDGKVVSICGSNELYSSPEHAYFHLLEALANNKDKTVRDVLYDLSLNITCT